MNRREFLNCMCCAGVCQMLPQQRKSWHEFARPMMGSVVSLALYGERSPCETLSSGCFSAMERAVSELTDWEEESPVSCLNRRRSIEGESYSTLLPQLLAEGERLKDISGGLFLPSMRRLSVAWREAKNAASTVDRRLCLLESRFASDTQASIKKEHIELCGRGAIDFGGIGKGFIADFAAGYLRKNGIRFARVACSGDLRFAGRTEWIVDIEHPRDEDKMLATLVLKGEGAVSTSGDYRACWFVNGKRLHHLIDPRTGLPGTVNMQATVAAPNAALADALATALFFARPNEAERILKRVPGAFALLVRGDGRPYAAGDRSLLRSAAFS